MFSPICAVACMGPIKKKKNVRKWPEHGSRHSPGPGGETGASCGE